MTRSLLADAYGHHVWATLTLLDVCLTLDDTQLATDVPGTYGSILAIARHTVGADCGYLYALTGGTYPEIDEDNMSMAELRAAMERNGPAWTALLEQELDPDTDVVRHRDDNTDSACADGDPPRPGRPSRHRSPQPDLYGADDHRDHAARDRCLGLRAEGRAHLGGGDPA